MDIALATLAFLFLIVGLAGSIVPVLPGPPLSYAGLLLLQWSGYAGFSSDFLWIWAGVTVAVTVADYFLPVWMTRRFGGSRAATIGSVIGVVAGIFLFPPVGLIVGPFLGALIGELINNSEDSTKAFRVAFGSFLAFIFGTGAKLIVSAIMLFYAIKSIL